MEDLLFRLEAGVAIITLNRPQRLNAMTLSMRSRFFKLLRETASDSRVRVLLITGGGRGFCAGMEMELLDNIGKEDEEMQATAFPEDEVLMSQVALLPKPVIIAVNGPCAGLGMVLASMGDLRFATKTAKFTTAFAKRGLVAEFGISHTLPRIVGVSNALDLLLSSRVILGEEAKEMGFVSKVFDSQEELMAYATKYAFDLAKYCSPASIAAMKRQIYSDMTKDLLSAERACLPLVNQSLKHPDSREGVQSYIEKRDPIFIGLAAGSIHQLLEQSKL